MRCRGAGQTGHRTWKRLSRSYPACLALPDGAGPPQASSYGAAVVPASRMAKWQQYAAGESCCARMIRYGFRPARFATNKHVVTAEAIANRHEISTSLLRAMRSLTNSDQIGLWLLPTGLPGESPVRVIRVAVSHRRAVVYVRSASDSDRFLCVAANDAKGRFSLKKFQVEAWLKSTQIASTSSIDHCWPRNSIQSDPHRVGTAQ